MINTTMATKPKMLFVSTRFPLPLHSGFANKNFNFLKYFSDSYDISILIISRDIPCKKDLDEMKKLVADVYVFKPKPYDIFLGLINVIFKAYPIQFSLFYSRLAHRKILEIQEDFDIVFGSVIRSWQYISDFNIPIYVDLADSLSETYKRNYKTLNNPIYKFVYFLESILLFNTERRLVKKASGSFLFNEHEVNALNAYGNVIKVPHGVHPHLLDDIKPGTKYKNDLIIFGKMDFHPNVDAVFWFVENVLPSLPKEIKLIIIGASPSDSINMLGKKNLRVDVIGFVDDPYPLISGALASIAPIRLGGGIQNKVLESLAVGANVVVSKMVADSMPDKHESGIIECNSVDDWIQNITKIYLKQINSNSEKSKSYIRNRFTWKAYAKEIELNINE